MHVCIYVYVCVCVCTTHKVQAEPLKMGPKCCPETSVTNHQPRQLNVPEERKSHKLHIMYFQLLCKERKCSDVNVIMIFRK